MRFPLYVIVIITDILTAALYCLSAIIDGMPIDEVYSSLPFFLLAGLIGSMYYVAFMATDPFTRIFFYSAGVSYILFGYNFNGTLPIYGYVPYSGGVPTSLGAILVSVIPAAVITGLSYVCYRIYGVFRKPFLRLREKKAAQKAEQAAVVRAEEAKAKKRTDWQQELLSFSNGRPVDIVLMINENHETSKYLERNRAYIDEKTEAYRSVLNGGAVKSARINGAIVDCICNTIKNELRLRDETGEYKWIYYIVYTTGFDYHSEEYTSGHLRKLVKGAELKDCKFRFVLDGPDSYTLSSERRGVLSFVETGIVHEYYKWKRKYPNHLIVVSDESSLENDAIALEKGAVVLNSLLYGDRNAVYDAVYNDVESSSKTIDELEPLSDTNEDISEVRGMHQGLTITTGDPLAMYGDYRHIAIIAASSWVVIPTLNKYRINYVLVKDKKVTEKQDFGENYAKFPRSLFPGYRFNDKDFHEAYILSGVRKYRYYNGKRWDYADNIVMKKKSHWVSKYPDAVVIEIKSNKVDASVDVLGDASKYVLDALTDRGWGNEHRRSAFRAADILENAKVDYVIIHSGKVEFENKFPGGKERYLKYLEAGRKGKHIPRVSLKLEKSIYHWESLKEYDDVIRDLEEKVNDATGENPDHVIAHAMSKFRKNEAPDLTIKLFNRYAELAGDHMLVSVAAAYGDIRLFDKAMYYIDQAPDGEYKEITKNRIIRDRRNYTY